MSAPYISREFLPDGALSVIHLDGGYITDQSPYDPEFIPNDRTAFCTPNRKVTK